MKVRGVRLRAKTKYVSRDGVTSLRDIFVRRCRTYVAGCVTCDTWRFRNEKGRFAYNFDELKQFMNQGVES